MNTSISFVIRGLVTVILFCVAAFCAFGFLASFEPPIWYGWQVGYAVAGSSCLVGMGALWMRSPRGSKLAAMGLMAMSTFSVLALRPLFAAGESGLGTVCALVGSISLLVATWHLRTGPNDGIGFRLVIYLLLFVAFGVLSIPFDLHWLIPLLQRL